MRVHTDPTKHTLGLDKMVWELKVELDKKEQDLALWEAMLTEENWEELMDLIELRRCLDEGEEARIVEAGQVAVLLGDISKVLVDLGMPPIPRIP
jgi:hypothetical protein